MTSDPNSTDLSPLDYHVWGTMLKTCHKLQRSQKHFPSLKMHFSWFGLRYQRKPLTTL